MERLSKITNLFFRDERLIRYYVERGVRRGLCELEEMPLISEFEFVVKKEIDDGVIKKEFLEKIYRAIHWEFFNSNSKLTRYSQLGELVSIVSRGVLDRNYSEEDVIFFIDSIMKKHGPLSSPGASCYLEWKENH